MDLNIEELKTKFNRIYPNLPLNEREMPIVVVDGEPLSWSIVRLELNTEIGKKALELMSEEPCGKTAGHPRILHCYKMVNIFPWQDHGVLNHFV